MALLGAGTKSAAATMGEFRGATDCLDISATCLRTGLETALCRRFGCAGEQARHQSRLPVAWEIQNYGESAGAYLGHLLCVSGDG